MADRHLCVCYFGTYDGYTPRNVIIPQGLQENNVEVVTCRAELWGNTEDRISLASGRWATPRFVLQWGKAVLALVRQYVRVGEHDAVVVGYPGILDVYLGWFLTRFTRKLLVYDALMSLHLIACERGIAGKHPFSAWLLFWVEKIACWLADVILLDTEAYANYFCETYGLPREKFVLLPLGADARVFSPRSFRPRRNGQFHVVHYGTFIPGTGVDVMVKAAALLRDDTGIVFEFIGDGQTRQEMEALAARLKLTNVKFVGWVDKSELPHRVADADVCLGVFSRGLQASMTVVNKLYECLAMAKPIITGDSPAVRSVLHHLEHAYLCAREDPEALAEAICVLRDAPELRERIARQGHVRFRERFTPRSIGSQLRNALVRRLETCRRPNDQLG